MKKVLAIDTTTQACSVALALGQTVINRYQLASREHTRLLLPMVNDLLSEAGMKLTQLDALAFTLGPGSFTGIRIGFSAIQGLALGAALPVLPVSSLETLAHTALRQLSLQDNCRLLPMFDARMDEIYWSAFEWNGIELIRLLPDSLSSPERVTLPESQLPLTAIGDGWQYAERIGLQPAEMTSALLPDARDVLTIAMPQIVNGNSMAIDDVQPLYLRDKVSWQKRKRLREGTNSGGTGIWK
ncbi:tRNA (adenosine(37)-N6)-threonylcarbamoyltransferase complex dimerization subunit type 1 TsaB [Porticoccus sp.]|uniref:tRNA (adenosine(37)-N6)-threonylcarbamoyltransferase complex dimerization subunit type 1 TsaB n=1 Tax=Porticoccus sp. TaxID=2024853 RepID=UPI003F6A2ACF